MGGAGLAGSGGVGVGGWQLYEGVINPTTHRQLSNQGYTWNPAQIPLRDAVPTNNQTFIWDKWGSCVTKLFGNVEIKYNEVTSPQVTTISSTTISGEPSKQVYFQKPNKVTDQLTACALLDQRGSDDASLNNIYFKAEVAARDQDYGWVMWNGLSTTKGSPTKTHMEYRFLLLKKENGSWKVDKGFGWSSPKPPTSSESIVNNDNNHLFVTLPIGKFQPTNYELGGYSSRKIWSAIAKADSSITTTEDNENNVTIKHDLLSGLKIYMYKKDGEGTPKAEFFGSSGILKGTGNEGYMKVDKYYDSNSGWKTISSPIDLKDTITEWYKEQGDKQLRWMTCDSWAGDRRAYSQSDSWDETMKEMCYSK